MNPENLFNKDKQSTNPRLQDPLTKKLWLLDAKITQKWALIPFKNACNILRLGQNFARPTLFEVLFYTPASHPFGHLLVVTVVLHALSDKVKEIIEIANLLWSCSLNNKGLLDNIQRSVYQLPAAQEY